MSRQRVAARNVDRWLRGEIALGELLKVTPDDRAELAWQAQTRLERGDIGHAERLYALLEQLGPAGDTTGALGRGVCLQRRGELVEAERAYGEVLEACPNNLFALVNRAEVRLLGGRFELARVDLHAAHGLLERRRDRHAVALRKRVEQLLEQPESGFATHTPPATEDDERGREAPVHPPTSGSSAATAPGRMTTGGGRPRGEEGSRNWSDTGR